MCKRSPIQSYLGHEVRTTKETKESYYNLKTTCSVQNKGIERGIECIGFEGFNQVRIEGSIGVSKRGPSTSYPCARGAQYNLIWAMR
jgi:hypothetical protein